MRSVHQAVEESVLWKNLPKHIKALDVINAVPDSVVTEYPLQYHTRAGPQQYKNLKPQCQVSTPMPQILCGRNSNL